MVDNRYATAVVIGSVLSLLAAVYLSVAVGTQYWYQYHSPPAVNTSDLRSLHKEFLESEFDEKTYSDALFRLNGTLGLWWRCILGPADSHWYKEPEPTMVTQCVTFTLPQQIEPKYKEVGNHNSETDLLRSYLWRCQFLLPLVSLSLVTLGALVGIFSCLCHSLAPMLVVGVFHLLAGFCSLATVCCFLAGMHLLHQATVLPEGVEHSLGWSLYLALVSSPLQMMTAALLIWASHSHRRSYRRMTIYRVA
ncbi:claudin domain-containing protein 1-like [Scleropages formosus]|uniref:Claudin domain containing 1b n=1 Tax=Scleropages formosus TaxID=113540 RepID=A0A8C9RM07_SCLFO|nr:claudin domain-containing protein 1-like [Scleropages formosus]